MIDAPHTDDPACKSALRQSALARRDALEIDDRLEWDQAICERALSVLSTILSTRLEAVPSAAVLKDASVRSGASFETKPAASPQDEGFPRQAIVSAYWPMRSEADPRPVLEALHARGVPLCLPAIVAGAMAFRRWAPWQPIVPGGFGTLVPQPDQPETSPSILLVPLAAFDRRGYRIGYGKGHYDRALAALGDVVTIGIAYAAQEIAAVPDEPHDKRLDWIVTQDEAIRCS